MWPFSKEYSLKIHGRAGMTYREAGRSLKVDSEMMFKDYDMVVYWSEVKHWNPPFDSEELSDAEKARIKANLEKELKKLRIDWV
jgi:hypothetical protein